MIEVSHLTKRNGAHTAVSDLSFTIGKGRIYGFLGPNGAGKSTTMNIIAGCMGATEGTVRIDGHDVFEEPLAAKKRVGYLPEQPPLYTEMTPEEYLRFVASAKGVPRGEQERQLRAVMERTKLEEVRHRLIAHLSKGYRQRVGIAQALLGSPEIIILDEPTVGLDPAQIIEIRELIRALGHGHTIVLSSHILSEVQAVCDQIMILAHGKLVASDTAENLTSLLSAGATIELEARGDEAAVRGVLEGLPGVAHSVFSAGEAEGLTHVALTPLGESDLREAVFARFAGSGVPLLELRRDKATLEDVFLELTQGEQADAAEEKEAARA